MRVDHGLARLRGELADEEYCLACGRSFRHRLSIGRYVLESFELGRNITLCGQCFVRRKLQGVLECEKVVEEDVPYY